MDRVTLKTRIEEIVLRVASCENSGIDAEEIDLSSLGIDSIGLVTIVCIVEDEFGITIPEQNLFRITCFRDFVDTVYKIFEK